jgi:NADH-quinone oxidoreductase subunit H
MRQILDIFMGPGKMDIIFGIMDIVVPLAIIVAVVMLHVAYATWAERKVIGRMQVRMGPTRVGKFGLLQPIADGVKLFFKEDLIPDKADKPVFYLAPVISLVAALSSLAVLPFYYGFALADINIGLLYILALSSVGAYGIVMSGWASNSKYSFLGSLRSSAQIISYEVAMGLSLVGVMIMAGSLNLNEIIAAQEAYPTRLFVIPQILGAVVFMLAALAETNRTPFDLPEAESELVAGYFTEYSGFRFSLFFMAEYIGMIMMAVLGTVCFFGGGWPFNHIPILGLLTLMLKVYFFMFAYYWIRATVPRYRYDQLMSLGWKVLIPVALLNIVITATIKMFG